MAKRNRTGRNVHTLADIGLPEPPPKRCGKCIYCIAISKVQGIGKPKELVAIYNLTSELQPIQFRRLSEFSDAACVDLGGALVVLFPDWLADGMIGPILEDVSKIINVDNYMMVNGCG